MLDLNRTLQLVKGALFDSEATWQAYLPEAGDWQKTAFLLTGPLIVASTLIAYFLGLLSSDVSMLGPMRPSLGSSLLNLVVGACAAALVAFIFSFFAGQFGGRHNFALGLAATSLAFVPGYLGQALIWLPWLGGLLAIALGIYGLVLLWRIIPTYLEVPGHKRTLHYVVSLVTSIVVMAILSSVTARVLYGPNPGAALGGMSGSGQDGSLFGGAMRQAELIAAAQEDRYSPPQDGLVSDAQVREFIRVMDRSTELGAEKQQRMQELAEKADNGEDISMREMTELMGAATEVAGLQNGEIEIVKSAGGNWAEHQWIRETLRTAWLQKDINATVEKNYQLYLKYEDQLVGYVGN